MCCLYVKIDNKKLNKKEKIMSNIERKALELIEKHISDYGDCNPGLEYYGNLIFDATRQGVCVVKKIIEIFEKVNIDTVIFNKQFNDKYCIEGDAIFYKDKTELIRFEPSTNLKECEIPCNVLSNAFEDSKLEKIIVNNNVNAMGSKVFLNCNKLKEIIFQNGETKLDNCCFDGCNDSLVIKAPAGGYIEEYAKKYNIKFEAI